MKIFGIGVLLFMVSVASHATTPFAPKVFVNDSFTVVIGFAWPDQDENILMIRTRNEMSHFSTEELGLPIEVMTTAGSKWYQNSIGYVTSLQTKDAVSGSLSRIFYFRNRVGQKVIIDVNLMKRVEPATILDQETLNRKTESVAADLLKSKNPKDRQTAAIHLGQLGSKSYLEDLGRLLEDGASYTEYSGGKSREVYYVKEAAERAIELINMETDGSN